MRGARLRVDSARLKANRGIRAAKYEIKALKTLPLNSWLESTGYRCGD